MMHFREFKLTKHENRGEFLRLRRHVARSEGQFVLSLAGEIRDEDRILIVALKRGYIAAAFVLDLNEPTRRTPSADGVVPSDVYGSVGHRFRRKSKGFDKVY